MIYTLKTIYCTKYIYISNIYYTSNTWKFMYILAYPIQYQLNQWEQASGRETILLHIPILNVFKSIKSIITYHPNHIHHYLVVNSVFGMQQYIHLAGCDWSSLHVSQPFPEITFGGGNALCQSSAQVLNN